MIKITLGNFQEISFIKKEKSSDELMYVDTDLDGQQKAKKKYGLWDSKLISRFWLAEMANQSENLSIS